MVKDHSESERGNPLLPPGLLFQLAARVLLYAPSHRQDSTYLGLCYTSRGALAGPRNRESFRCILTETDPSGVSDYLLEHFIFYVYMASDIW